MFECLIVGDSIAVGTHRVLPECVTYAKGGINSWQWNKDNPVPNRNLSAKTAIISLGSNDHKGVNTFKELMVVREKVQADHVYWIMPAIKPQVQEIVRKVAATNNDTVIEIKHLQPDGVHPSMRGYKDIASQAKL